jgi:large subunit ribosomal protein L37
MLLATRLLNHCERFYGRTRAVDRKIVNNAFFVAPFERDGEKIQLELTAETFMTSRKPIAPFKVTTATDLQLPNIFPLKHTVSIPKVHFYKEQNAYRE